MNVHFDFAVPPGDGEGLSDASLARVLEGDALNWAERYAAAILVEEHRFGLLLRSLGTADYHRRAGRHLRSQEAQKQYARRMGAALTEFRGAPGVDDQAFVRLGCETMRIVTAARVRVGRHYRDLMARS